MPSRLELTGKRFGRLAVINPAPSSDCGSVKVVATQRLRFGETRSCGCLERDNRSAIGRANKRHGHSTREHKSPEYYSWTAMLARCRDPNAKHFDRYGGRGIAVCKRWLKFENFLADMGKRPKGKTLDRFPNPDGNYKKRNCRWATPKEQRNNRGRK